MIPLDHGDELILNQRLRSFERAQGEARQKSEEAHRLSAEAGAKLMADLITALGPGVLTLANAMVYGQMQLLDRLIQITDLAAGGCDRIKATILDYGGEGNAMIVLTKTPGGIAVSIKVSEDANHVVIHSARATAGTLAMALGFKVPVTEEMGGG